MFRPKLCDRLQLFGVKPHLAETFKLSSDPFFIEKVRNITGLYLNPPDRAVVPCVDEKAQIQALDRTQPALPLGLGYTHDYVRHGTTTLFAAHDVTTGKVLAHCKKRHRHQEWLAFLRLIHRRPPRTSTFTLCATTTPHTNTRRCGPGLPSGRACTCTSRRTMPRG